jgi:murein DD-endopeptidase MepM/ murein hydrolase activator NlpD
VDQSHRRRRSLLFAVLLGLLVAAPAGPGYASPRDDKNRVDRQLQETAATLEAATQRAQQAAVQHEAATAALPGAQAAQADAQGRAIGAEAAAQQAERENEAAAAAERAARGQYDDAADAVNRGRQSVSVFVAAAYKGSGFMMANTVMAATDPEELATTIGYLDHIAADQQQALDALTSARMVAKQRTDAAQLARERADRAADRAQQALADAQAAQVAAAQATANVKALIVQTAQSAAIANHERSAVVAQYAELQRESDRVGAQLRALAAQEQARNRAKSGGSSVTAPSQLRPGAFFLMPVHGWKSSNFGMRYDPYYHVYQLHAGVDLAAPGGSPIAAAADGTVVRTGWHGGYGNYTCISHGEYQGKGLATCYGHQSKILVSVGEQVNRGEVIGLVGTTGASTGYHLHFEVRINGTPVQPLNWLPACLC